MRELTADEKAYCQGLADAAPPFTDEQRRSIQRFLGPAARRAAKDAGRVAEFAPTKDRA